LKMLRYLKEIKVDDVAIDFWIAVITSDMDLLEKVFPFIDNPNITDVELIKNHQELLKNKEIGAVFAKWLFVVRQPIYKFNA